MKTEYITSTFATAISYLIGGIDTALEVLLVIMCLDIATGVIKAAKGGKFASKNLREGLVHKAGYLIVIIICYQADVLIFDGQLITRTAAVVFYIAVEIGSIIENLGEMGVPIPKVIQKRLSRLNEMSEEIETNDKGEQK